jgi:putative SOS response-associated peptidase YedK
MPVILSEEFENQWISGDISLRKAHQLLVPYDESALHAHTVSARLAASDLNPGDAEIIKPYAHQIPGKLF